MGPVVAGYAVEKMGWRWSAWELLWLSAPMTVLMLCALPETSSDAILLRRAKRLRLATGCNNFKHESEVHHSHLSAGEIISRALIKPWEINALDPAVLFTTVYLALDYAIYYSFFESFPLVYRDIYGFSLGAMGLAFLSMMVGLLITSVGLGYYMYFFVDRNRVNDAPPESKLIPGIFGSICIPVGLFLFGTFSIFMVFSMQSHLTNTSVDFEALDPLDCIHGQCGHMSQWCLSCRTSCPRLSTLHVPSLCWISICCQWTRPKPFCGFCCPIFSTHVQKLRRIWRCELVRRPECAVYHGYSRPLHLWCKS